MSPSLGTVPVSCGRRRRPHHRSDHRRCSSVESTSVSVSSLCDVRQYSCSSIRYLSSISSSNRNITASRRGTALLSFLLFMAAFVINSESRSFSVLGCLGEHDISKFAELDRICEDCYQVYRESELNTSCRKDCFHNEVFGNCVDALKLSHEKKKLLGIVNQLFG